MDGKCFRSTTSPSYTVDVKYFWPVFHKQMKQKIFNKPFKIHLTFTVDDMINRVTKTRFYDHK